MTQTGSGVAATPGQQGSQGSIPTSGNSTPRSSNAGGRGDEALRAVAEGFKSLGEALDHSHEKTITPKIEVKVCSKDDSESILLTLTSVENQASIGGYSKAFDGKYIEKHLPYTEKDANELDPADKSNVEARRATRMNQCGVAVLQAAFGGLPGIQNAMEEGKNKYWPSGVAYLMNLAVEARALPDVKNALYILAQEIQRLAMREGEDPKLIEEKIFLIQSKSRRLHLRFDVEAVRNKLEEVCATKALCTKRWWMML
eukprot:scaffold31476_cov23-Cyclotella_meneghiniana.AAC.1